jgi:hypothetical protein
MIFVSPMLDRRAMLASLSLAMVGCSSNVIEDTDQPEANAAGNSSLPPEALNNSVSITVSEPRTAVRSTPRFISKLNLWDVTFDHLKFDMPSKEIEFRREMLTPTIEALDGKRIRVRGFINSFTFFSQINSFALMRDNQECCFGDGAWLYDCIWVEMQPGANARFVERPVTVEGEFEINEVRVADVLRAIYVLRGASVK